MRRRVTRFASDSPRGIYAFDHPSSTPLNPFDIPFPPSENPPMVSQELLDLLVCPLCKKPLELKNEGQSLKCSQCRRVYPIKDDIPVMLIDEAKVEE